VRLRNALAAILVGALLAPIPALAQGSGVIKRQENAGTLGADGYLRAVTKAGDMQVEMPCKYSELRLTDPRRYSPGEHVANSGTVLNCTDFESQPFVMAMRSQYTTGAAGADHFYGEMLKDDRKKGEVVELEINGDRAFRSLVIEEDACKWNLSVRHGDELISVGVIIFGEDCKKREPEALRSMNSLVFE
jgi:hypothetical protein